ncbi:hypothetical protein BDZ89DRAFT_112528 [Hymenopellis radicata]|nr:hypothetical protein BDZ89DRAFT_112528 [Hymenopellis radicata]
MTVEWRGGNRHCAVSSALKCIAVSASFWQHASVVTSALHQQTSVRPSAPSIWIPDSGLTPFVDCSVLIQMQRSQTSPPQDSFPSGVNIAPGIFGHRQQILVQNRPASSSSLPISSLTRPSACLANLANSGHQGVSDI